MHNLTVIRATQEERELLPRSSLCWIVLAYRSYKTVIEYLREHPLKSSAADGFGLLIPMLRQELVVATLLSVGAQHYLDSRRLHPAEVALRRLLSILRKTHSSTDGVMKLDIVRVIKFYEVELKDLLARGRRAGNGA